MRKELGKTATENADYFLTTLFPASELHIMDYNRVIKNLNGHSPEDFINALRENFIVETIGKNAYKPKQLHEFGMYLEKKWYKLLHLEWRTHTL